MNGRYLTLAGRIRQEIGELERVVERTQRIWREAATRADDYLLDATALNLHGYYARIERLFEMISDIVDQAKPTGANWHQELLRQMTVEIPGIRPAVLSEENRNALDEFRGFRHVVRNVYSYNLDPVRIGLLVKKLIVLSAGVHAELRTFTKFLEDIANES
ncbi:MAG: hypothetical protein R2911_12950 [Caldilineaceae bacterium]